MTTPRTTQKALELKGMTFGRDEKGLTYRVAGPFATIAQAEMIAEVGLRVEMFVTAIKTTVKIPERGWSSWRITSTPVDPKISEYGKCYHCDEAIQAHRSGPCFLCEAALKRALATMNG